MRASKNALEIVSGAFLFTDNCENELQNEPPKVTLFRGWALLGHLWHSDAFLNAKNVAKVLQKWFQGTKKWCLWGGPKPMYGISC